VAKIELASEVAKDFDRILNHLTIYQVEKPGQRIGEIITALDVLEQNPLIGRPVANGKRELVIGRRHRGYLALYRYVPSLHGGRKASALVCPLRKFWCWEEPLLQATVGKAAMDAIQPYCPGRHPWPSSSTVVIG
jgi:plasmid stabilization system protein ParE